MNRPRFLRTLFTELLRLRDLFANPKKPATTLRGRLLRLEDLEDRTVPAASMSVVKVAAFAPGGDVNSNGKFDPGDTIQYTVTVTNNGTVDLTGVTFDDLLDANTTLGSVNVSPLARDDAFTAVANTQLDVGTPAALSGPAATVAGNVLANDQDFFGDTFAISAFDAASSQGGTVAMVTSGANAGSFSYVPAVGFTGADSFTYTLRDKGIDGIAGNADDLTSVGKVNITVAAQKVWYVDSAYAGGNGASDGRSTRPFTSLASVTGATGPDAAGDIIYLSTGSGNYTGGITLLNTQTLWGQNEALVVGGFTLQAAGTDPVITNAAGNGVTLGANDTLKGFTVGDTTTGDIVGTAVGTLAVSNVVSNGTGPIFTVSTSGALNVTLDTATTTSSTTTGISLTGVTGSFTATAGAISGVTGTDVNVSGGTATIAIADSITNTAGRSVAIDGHTTNNVTLSGTISDTGTGILVQNNTSGTIAFSGANNTLNTGTNTAVNLNTNTGATVNFTGGGLIIDTTSGTGFSATGGGTVNVTGAGNTITSTTGTALNVSNTTIGASGLTFQSISANGGTNGIILDTTGASGGLTVTGTVGSTSLDNSGGTIQNLTGTDGTTAGHGIYLNSTSNVSLNHMNIHNVQGDGIHGNAVAGFTLTYTSMATNGTTTAQLGNFHGEGDVNFVTLSGSATVDHNNFQSAYYNTFGVFNDVAPVSLNRIVMTSNTFGANDTAGGNAGVVFRAVGGTMNVTFGSSAATANTITGAGSNTFIMDLHGNVSADLIMKNNAISNNHPNIVTGGGGVSLQSGGTGDQVNLTFNVDSNTFSGSHGAGFFIGTGQLDAGNTFAGTFNNNTIGIQGTPNSGSTTGNDLFIDNEGSSTNINVTNNKLYQYNPNGTGAMQLQVANDNGHEAQATFVITGNTISNPGTTINVYNGIQLNAGTSAGDTAKTNLTLYGNTVVGSGNTATGSADIRLRQRFSATIGLFGNGSNYGGTQNDTTAIANFAVAQNGGTGSAVSSAPGGFFGTVRFLMFAPSPTDSPSPTATILPIVPSGIDLGDGDGDSSPPVVTVPVVTPAPPVIVDDGVLSQAELDSLVGAAIARWDATGLTAAQVTLLHNVTFSVEDLPGWTLGEAAPGHVTLDSNAAGNAWFIDATPLDDSEFSGTGTELTATATGGAVARVDALTTVMHELGHQLGLDDIYDRTAAANLMYGFIGQSERRLPAAHQADGADSNMLAGEAGPDFAFATVNIGSLPIGKAVTIKFNAQINNGIPVHSVSNQGTADSVETPAILSDDPGVGGTADPTVTQVDLPDVTVALPTTSVAENGGTNLVYTFTRQGSNTLALTANVTLGGTATLGTDYTQTGITPVTATTGTITFAAGSSTAVVTVTPTGDAVVEDNETVILTVAPGPGYDAPGDATYGGASIGTQTGTITNDDNATVTLTGGIAKNETNSGTVSYVFTATLNNAVQGGFKVAYTTSDSGATAGSDYTDNDGTLTFLGNAGETQTITVLVNGDNTVELNEDFIVALGALSNSTAVQLAAISKSGSPQTGTITNDDAATVSLAGNVSQSEGTTPQVFTVTLSNPVDVPVTVLFNTSDSTATAGSDYTGITNQTVTFPAGSTTAQVVNVAVANDAVVEDNEVVNVALSNLAAGGRNVSLGTSTGTGTITNDDTATLTLTGGIAQNEGNSGTTSYVFTATLSKAVQGGFDVAYSTNDGTATAGSDYVDNDGSLHFTGTVGESHTITVLVNGDTTIEPDETFTVALGSISNTTPVQTAAISEVGSPQTGTILTDDTDVSVAVSPSSVLEDGPTNMVYTFTRTGKTSGGITVNFNVTGAATFNTDYTVSGAASFNGTTGSVFIGDGLTSATVTVDPTADTTAEPDEDVVLTLTSGVNYRVASPSVATGTILDDDVKVTVAASPSSVAENSGTGMVYTFTRTGDPSLAQTVNFSYSGTATFTSDYTESGAVTFSGGLGTITFAAGSPTATLTLIPVGDTTVEDDETAIVTLTAGTGYGIGAPGAATGTITNDDTAALTLTGGIAQAEGNSGTTAYTFAVTLSNAVQGGFNVAYTTNDVTATAGTDYTDNDGTLTFAGTAGETQTITVLVNGDNLVELNETFTVALGTITTTSAVQIAAITPSGSPQMGTITNDDSATVSLAGNVSQTEATTPQVFTVTLSNPVDVPVTVQFNTSDGTATTADLDYTGITNQTVTFAAGSTTAQVVNVAVNNDAIVEDDEVFNVGIGTLSASGRNVALGTNTATGTITNNDTATLTLSGGIAQNEGNSGTTAYTFTVTLNNAVQGGFTVPYTTNNGTATAVSDYIDNDGTLTFAGTAGESQTITVLVKGDTTVEPNEDFTVVLGAITGLTPVQLAAVSEAGSPQTGTITNDDTDVSVTVSPASTTEDSGPNLVYTFTRVGVLSSPLTVNFNVGGSATFNTDYTASSSDTFTFNAGSGTVTFGAGNNTATITITPVTDAVDEPNEDVILTLVSGTGYTAINPTAATGTINDDDLPPAFSIGDMSVNEAAGTVTFTVTRNGATAFTTSVDYATANDTATSASTGPGTPDFSAKNGTLNFPASTGTADTQTVTVSITNDLVFEGSEQFFVNLTNATAGKATISDAQGIGTITDDDALPSYSINDVTVNENGTATFTVTLTGATSFPTSVNYATADDTAVSTGSATPGTPDYTSKSGTLNFPASASATRTLTFTVPITTDTVDEIDEQFFVNLSNATGGATIGDTQGVGTITDDDNPPSISITSPSVAEGASGTTALTFTVTLSAATSKTVTVDFATADGTATLADNDYQSKSGTLTFAPGETSKTVTVLVNGDIVSEADETFTVGLSGATNATTPSPTGTGTILNDDIAPETTIGTKPSAVTSSTSAKFTFTGVTNGGPGPLTFQYTLDGVGPITAASPLTLTGLSDGLHTFQVQAVNSLGTADPTPASYSWTVDTVKPTVLLGSPTPVGIIASGPVTYSVTITDANFNGSSFAASDFTLNKTGTANGTIGLSGSGNNWTVTVSNITGNGTLGITLKAGSIADLAGNTSAAAVVGATFAVDNTAPIATISAPSVPDLTSGSVTYTVTYADANLAAITLGTGDVVLHTTGTATGTVASVTIVDATTRLVTISGISGDGALSISLLAGTAVDTAGNLAAASGPSAVVHVVPPTRKLDMTSSTASVPDASWASVRGNTLYTAATGYGWTTVATEGDSATNFPAGSNASDQNLYRDYHLGGGTATFQVYVGVGKSASVKVYSYPQSVYSLGMTVAAEGGTTATVGSVPYVTVTGNAGTDGILTVTMRGGIFGMWLVNAMEVTVL